MLSRRPNEFEYFRVEFDTDIPFKKLLDHDWVKGTAKVCYCLLQDKSKRTNIVWIRTQNPIRSELFKILNPDLKVNVEALTNAQIFRFLSLINNHTLDVIKVDFTSEPVSQDPDSDSEESALSNRSTVNNSICSDRENPGFLPYEQFDDRDDTTALKEENKAQEIERERNTLENNTFFLNNETQVCTRQWKKLIYPQNLPQSSSKIF